MAHLLDIPLGDLHAEICQRPQHQVKQIQSVSTTTKTPGYKKTQFLTLIYTSLTHLHTTNMEIKKNYQSTKPGFILKLKVWNMPKDTTSSRGEGGEVWFNLSLVVTVFAKVFMG